MLLRVVGWTLFAAILVPVAHAGHETTAPDIFVTIHVKLTDNKIILSQRIAPRGSDARFVITNVGTRPHSFTLGRAARGMGVQTGFDRVLKPNEQVVALLLLDYRGKLGYRSRLTADRRLPGMRGVFIVGEDVTGSVSN